MIVGDITVKVTVDPQAVSRADLLEFIRGNRLEDEFATALVQTVTDGKAKVFSDGVVTDLDGEGVLDGPELVLRILGASRDQIQASIDLVSRMARYEATGIIDGNNEMTVKRMLEENGHEV